MKSIPFIHKSKNFNCTAKAVFTPWLQLSFIVIIIFQLIGSCPAMGQQYLFRQSQSDQKKLLPYEYVLDTLWSSDIQIKNGSPDGNWVALVEVFPIKGEVGILAHAKNGSIHKFPQAFKMEFDSRSKWFISLSRENELTILDLRNMIAVKYSGIRNFSLSYDSKYLAFLEVSDTNKTTLHIKNFTTQKLQSFEAVEEFTWSPENNNLLAVFSKDKLKSVVRLDVEANRQIPILEYQKENIAFLKWNSTGNCAVFSIAKNDANTIYLYDIKGNLFKLNNDSIEKHYPNYKISDWEPHVSEDANRIIFYRQKKDTGSNLKNVEVWDSNDPWIFPRMQFYKETTENKLLTLWYPKTNEFREVETTEHPSAALNVDKEIALVFNPKQYEPLYKYDVNADLFIKDLKTGAMHLVCKNQYTEGMFVQMSPDQKFIAYFNENHWWVYSLEKGTTLNLTKDIEVSFQNTVRQLPGNKPPYDHARWFPNDKYIILHDRFDIWKLSPDGNYKERITNGRETNTTYRVSKNYKAEAKNVLTGNINFSGKPLQTDNGVILEVFDNTNMKTGIAIWTEMNKIVHLALGEYKMDAILPLKDKNTLVYRKQRFNSPIGIYSLDRKSKKQHLIYQSNEALLGYDLGLAESIEYLLEDGKKLNASLLYPSGYDPTKKYPMIVHIYEKQSKNVMTFHPPSNYGQRDFNYLKYVTDGYFVLLPDIDYTTGDPGISALNSVRAAVNKVIENGKVDTERIGLIGHSFGGYETSFIITQTDMFKAAVAGSAPTDLINKYHSVYWESNESQIWRMENQQFRFGSSLYEDKDAYYRNSPLHHVENITTPLLLWTGKEDTNVNWTQSVNLFIALKRLNKTSKLLLFEKEGHLLFKKENQFILSKEIKNWFDGFLKP